MTLSIQTLCALNFAAGKELRNGFVGEYEGLVKENLAFHFTKALYFRDLLETEAKLSRNLIQINKQTKLSEGSLHIYRKASPLGGAVRLVG